MVFQNHLKSFCMTLFTFLLIIEMISIWMGYWASLRLRWMNIGQVFFTCLWTKRESLKVQKHAKKELGQYQAMLTKQVWLVKKFITWKITASFLLDTGWWSVTFETWWFDQTSSTKLNTRIFPGICISKNNKHVISPFKTINLWQLKESWTDESENSH